MDTPDSGRNAEDQSLPLPFLVLTPTVPAVILRHNGEVTVNWKEVEEMARAWEPPKGESGPPFTSMAQIPYILCKVLESLRAGAVRDDAQNPPVRPLEHDEARSFAAMRSGQSNLARCYLDLHKNYQPTTLLPEWRKAIRTHTASPEAYLKCTSLEQVASKLQDEFKLSVEVGVSDRPWTWVVHDCELIHRSTETSSCHAVIGWFMEATRKSGG